MIETRYADDEIINGLIKEIGLQARRDYIDATEALRNGRLTVHGMSAVRLRQEIEDWLCMMVDYEMAEAYIAELRKLGPEDRNSRATIKPRNHKEKPRGVSKRK